MNHTNETHSQDEFTWHAQPAGGALILSLLQTFRSGFEPIAVFEQQLLERTGTRLLDWIDHIACPASSELANQLVEAGFEPQAILGGHSYQHPGALFPPVRLIDGSIHQLAFRVDSIVDFLAAQGRAGAACVCGNPLAAQRSATIAENADFKFVAIERHGPAVERQTSFSDHEVAATLRHHERFRLRQRDFADDATGFQHAESLICEAIADLGVDRTCDLFFAVEREFWARRNRAARVQKARQDELGLGWANHDHHTYRSSRSCFSQLIGVLELLGFRCRERFYAGLDAGWGAQVIEQPNTRITIFADVDLSPEEVFGDFAHEPLSPREELGTVGLWCRLHGEAFLQAGMHHLECQFDFETTRDQLAQAGVKLMKPFTDFPWLRQAFSEGEVWSICPERIAGLLSEGAITPAQADQFRAKGAIGSHLEVLQRGDGYKGFNQTGINEIIRETDPRLLTAQLGG